MRYGVGFYASPDIGLSLRDETRQREIDDAWDEIVLSTDERDQLLAMLRLKRYARESHE
jgi:hypothetical protein